MSNSGEPPSVLPFPAEYRASGLLLHVTVSPVARVVPFKIGGGRSQDNMLTDNVF